jgi:predicted membrane-bound spermidine synthase
VIVAVTGAVSMGLEVLASRSLALIFGSSLQSFAIVLAAFILGIGLGSAWIASARRRQRSDEGMISLLLCVAAGWIALLVFNIEGWVDFYRIARSGLGRTSVGYVYHQLLAGGIAVVVLGFPAACIGAVLPLMMRAVSRSGAPLGTQVGALLTWNTLGAVLGTLGTGFVLMPWAGLRNAFGVLALALAMVALIAAWRSHWRGGMAGAVAAGALIGCLFIFGGEGWRHVMSSGIFRAREAEFDLAMIPKRKQHIQILSYEDAADATVTVEQGDGVGAPADRGLRINGKPDASAPGDLSTQLLLAHLPMLVRPGAKDVFVLGLGSGITAGALRPYPVEQIVVAENCEPVIRAAKFFEAWNRRVLSDPRTHLWHEDARTVLKLRPQLYDVIITEPSNPWTVGVGSVFSLEYYELAASRLKPGGIMAQWFHVYEMHDGIVALVLRTFSSVFPYVEIWDTLGGDIVMLGSRQPWRTGPDVFRQSFAIDGVRADLAQIGMRSAEALLARQLASQRTGFAIAGSGPTQSDLFPLLEYAAPRAFYIGVTARILDRFDERTRQQLLASAKNRASFRGLSADEVQAAFGTFTSLNEELRDCVRRTAQGMKAPCAFTTNSALPALPLLPGNSPTNAATLKRAAPLFGGKAEQRLEAVGLVESVLRATRPPVNWPAAEWADLAAATAFDLGNLQRAEQLAALALELEPANAQASYVARVLERERQLRQAAP